MSTTKRMDILGAIKTAIEALSVFKLVEIDEPEYFDLPKKPACYITPDTEMTIEGTDDNIRKELYVDLFFVDDLTKEKIAGLDASMNAVEGVFERGPSVAGTSIVSVIGPIEWVYVKKSQPCVIASMKVKIVYQRARIAASV